MKEREVSERRLVTRLYNYWERICAGKKYPQIEKFSGSALSDVMDYCFILKTESTSNGLVHKYKFAGREVIKAFGEDPTGEIATSKINVRPGIKLFKLIDECAKFQKPLNEQGQFINDNDKIIKYRCACLPFGMGDKVTDIVVGISYKMF